MLVSAGPIFGRLGRKKGAKKFTSRKRALPFVFFFFAPFEKKRALFFAPFFCPSFFLSEPSFFLFFLKGAFFSSGVHILCRLLWNQIKQKGLFLWFFFLFFEAPFFSEGRYFFSPFTRPFFFFWNPPFFFWRALFYGALFSPFIFFFSHFFRPSLKPE